MIVLFPSAIHDGEIVVIVGIAGVTNIVTFVNPAEATEVQLPLSTVSVYAVPNVIPLIAPPAPVVGPAGVNV